MTFIFSFTVFFMLLYLAYPMWLKLFMPDRRKRIAETNRISKVSLILLSYNGKVYLENKINSLLNQLAVFEDYELIIIDDKSTDGSIDFLKSIKTGKQLKIILNEVHGGIPGAMNRAVEEARFDHLIFCDQRQHLSENALIKILSPLRFKGVGAASACISSTGKGSHCSFLRKHENFLKLRESMSGNLIGVYGPLYSIKKEYFSPIPDNIILDDLYLSLQILKKGEIEIVKDCEITDDNFDSLYNYQRAYRYLSGLLQIISDESIMKSLNTRQILMLLWHKYIRLLIPALGFSSYLCLGLWGWGNAMPTTLFVMGSLIIMFSLLPERFGINFKFKNLIRINIYYVMATFQIIYDKLIQKPLTWLVRAHFRQRFFHKTTY